MQRRELLWGGAAAGIAMASGRAFAQTANEKLIAWTDLPLPVPEPLQNVVKGITRWEDLDAWITPNDKWFSIAHYNRPQIDPPRHRGIGRQTSHTDTGPVGSSAPQGDYQYDRVFGEQWLAVRSEHDR
jgi:hypothetical protein